MKNYLHHLHFFCNDLQPTIDFWEQVLGAKFEQFRKFGDADGAVLDMNSISKIFLKKMACKPQSTEDCAGMDHPGIIVENLDATLEKARNLPTAKVTREPFMSGTLRCAFITGPEGIIIEVMEQTA